MHLAAIHHTPPYLHCIPCQVISTIFRSARCNISASGYRAWGPTTGIYYINVKQRIRVQAPREYLTECRECARDTRELANGDYRTVRSTVVRMPSLPPECLLVAAHASSLPPPVVRRRERHLDTARDRPRTAERDRIVPSLYPRAHDSPRLSPRRLVNRTSQPKRHSPPTSPISRSRLCSRRFALGSLGAWRCST